MHVQIYTEKVQMEIYWQWAVGSLNSRAVNSVLFTALSTRQDALDKQANRQRLAIVAGGHLQAHG